MGGTSVGGTAIHHFPTEEPDLCPSLVHLSPAHVISRTRLTHPHNHLELVSVSHLVPLSLGPCRSSSLVTLPVTLRSSRQVPRTHPSDTDNGPPGMPMRFSMTLEAAPPRPSGHGPCPSLSFTSHTVCSSDRRRFVTSAHPPCWECHPLVPHVATCRADCPSSFQLSSRIAPPSNDDVTRTNSHRAAPSRGGQHSERITGINSEFLQ